MRVPQSWLTEAVATTTPGFAPTSADLDATFVRIGFEIEDVEPFAPITGPVVIGQVTAIEELTEFRKPIRFCQVDVGESQTRGIVCGARNFVVGDLIVAALPGAVLPGDFAIAARETYGKVSDGMICSVRELAIGNEHDGILVLRPGTATPGADAREVLGLVDTAFDINVTPDRGYAFSVRGLGRELAAAYDAEYHDPAQRDVAQTAGDGYPVAIEPESGVRRFTALRVTGLDPLAATPFWIVKRLLVAGIRPISLAVDVTNYVMLELGQPLHAYDAAALTGPIVVRRARQGERLETLDGATRELDPEDVVVTDDSGPIALGGVMGGARTEVSPSTTDIVVEAANFDAVAAFRTGRRHKLSSEAAKRFERGVDPDITVAAVARAAELLAEYGGASVDAVYTDVDRRDPLPSFTVAADAPDRTAGVSYPAGTTTRRLVQVGCRVEDGGAGLLTVTPASWRPDLRQQADFVEEVLRLEGLEDIPSVLPSPPSGRGYTPEQKRRRAVGKTLALGGFVEVLPYPFMPAQVFDTWDLPADDPRRDTITVLNPLEASRPELNTTLLPGLLEMVGRNVARGHRDLALYAIGRVVRNGPQVQPVAPVDVSDRPTDEVLDLIRASVPDQPVQVAAVLTGLRDPAGPWGPGRAADYTDAFEAVALIADAAGVAVELRNASYAPWHPGRCAEVLVNDTVVGHAGELHPAVLERAGLPKRTCAVELDLSALPLARELPAPTLSPYPAVLQDVAVVVEQSVPAAAVRAALRDGAGELLEDIELFDVFSGEQVGVGRKSLAFALRFRAADRTLTEDEASAARDAAVAAAGERVGAELRA